MINRNNYRDVKQYLRYLEEVRRLDAKTLDKRWLWLRLLLEWADDLPLSRAPRKRPSFPIWLEGLRRDSGKQRLAHRTRKEVCGIARMFFAWANGNKSRTYAACKPAWRDTLVPGKDKQAQITEHEAWDISDIRQVMQIEPASLVEERDRAALTFLFLSGMRVGAFVSLPILAVDLAQRRVRQWPSLGVRTKFNKPNTSFLLHIPDLLAVVRAWDTRVRAALPETARWYAAVNPLTAELIDPKTTNRRSVISRGLTHLANLAGVRYYSPHKVRHGHAVYALKQARDLADMKAISQNLSHSDMRTTESIYAVLGPEDVGDKIGQLGDRPEGGTEREDKTEELLAKIDRLTTLVEESIG